MNQAIAGVAPYDGEEVTVATVWPSVAQEWLGPFPLGRWMGQLYNLKFGGYIFTLGNLFCLLSIPLALVLYFKRVLPYLATRYRLTSRRLVVEQGLLPHEDRSLDLDRFNEIEIEVLPGYEWYHAGDLVFRMDSIETFRIIGVVRPETFRNLCLNAHQSYVGVKRALEAVA